MRRRRAGAGPPGRLLTPRLPPPRSFFAATFGVGTFDSNIYGGVAAVAMVQVVLIVYVMRAWKEVFGPDGEVAAEAKAKAQ